MAEAPKIFISYSWTTPEHEDWVINLAERLVSDGVDVIIDKWNLKEGHDKYDFIFFPHRLYRKQFTHCV